MEKDRLLLSGLSDVYEWVNYYIEKSLGATTHVQVELRFFQHHSQSLQSTGTGLLKD